MKLAFSVACATALVFCLAVEQQLRQAPEWEDPEVNAINRLPARTYSVPLASEADALTDALEPKTPYAQSLNGTWKMSWAGNPELRVKDFWKTDFDDRAPETDDGQVVRIRMDGLAVRNVRTTRGHISCARTCPSAIRRRSGSGT